MTDPNRPARRSPKGHEAGSVTSSAPDRRWEAYVTREPYFAVLTSPTFLRANLTPEREREFFDTGEQLVDWIYRTIELRVAPHFAPMSTLEYGCGVGRLAIAFARRPGAVTAVDRSPAMLDAARREALGRGVDHIEFATPGELFASPRKFDLVCCHHVLQRLSCPEGLALVRALVDRIASGGIGVFHVPVRTRASRFLRASRLARERVPFLNLLANVLRRKPAGEPFIPTHVYDLDSVLAILDRSSMPASVIVFNHEEDLSSVMLFAEVPLPSITGRDEHGRLLAGMELRRPDWARDGARPIEVTHVIANTSIEELNQAAEQYFSSLADWNDHLAKPFSRAADAPALLVNVGTLVHGLRLAPGMRVVDFGAGSGWLSRLLTQLGCRVILLDVSATALAMARALYSRVPVVGDQPPPEFLPFDGRRIALADASVDRVITFDAFHHVPNPEEVLGEFGRILKPGAIAGFVEPGSRHSRTPMSQFEMRTYGVVENDVRLHAIWRAARQRGFREIKIAVLNGVPFHLSLDEYVDFLADGVTVSRWQTATRVSMRDSTCFFLIREGAEAEDSRAPGGLACAIAAEPGRLSVAEGSPLPIDVTVTNTGTARWLGPDAGSGFVSAGAHVYDDAGALLKLDVCRARLTDPPREIAPGETVRCRLTVPPQPAGRYRVEIDCVADRVAWFAQLGSVPAAVAVEIARSQNR